MIKNKILTLTESLLFLVVTGVMILAISWIEPVTPFKQRVNMIIPFLLITYFFFFLAFRVVSYYYQQLLHQKKLIEELNSAFIKLSAELRIDVLLKQSLELLMNFCGGTTGLMLILDKKLKRYASKDIFTININTTLDKKRITTGECIHRLLTFSPSEIPSDIDLKIRELLPQYDFKRCKTVIVIPVSDKSGVKAVAIIGTVTVTKKESSRVLDDMKNILDIFLRELLIELENSVLHEELNKASITDPLTCLYNRRYFNKRTQEEFARAKRMDFPLSIMISDLDNFKNYVDSYGHPKGDLILSEVASLVSKTVRETDIVCRFGGDEFSYLLPYASSVEAKSLAERIKKNVAQALFLKDETEQGIRITLSFGIASYPEHGNDKEEIISNADRALFKSKSNGKNMIMVYEKKER